MQIDLEFDQEVDGRWIAEVPAWPGVMAYGETRMEAAARVQALALRVLAERIENGEILSPLNPISFAGIEDGQMAVS